MCLWCPASRLPYDVPPNMRTSAAECHRGHTWEVAWTEKSPGHYELPGDESCPECGGHAAKLQWHYGHGVHCGLSLAECDARAAVREGERRSFYRRMQERPDPWRDPPVKAKRG